MTDHDRHRHPNQHRDNLTRLLAELRERCEKLEQQRVRIITAPVTAVDTVAGTFSVIMPVQQDGTSSTVSGIVSPSAFLPTIGDSVQLQVIGAVPQYQPARVADGAISSTELDPTVNNTIASKITVFRAPSQPVGLSVGDVWYDTDDGNKQYIWGPMGSVVRQNLTLNPSFEADVAGTVTSVTSWTNYTSGSPGTLTRSIASATGVASGTKCAKVVSASMPATSGTAMGYQQVFTAAPGDVFRIQAVLTLAVTDTNKLPELFIEWLNASNGVIGSATQSGSGTSTSQQTIAYNGAALPALTASVRLSIRRRSNGTGSALVNADLFVDAVLVEKNNPATAQLGYFDGDNPNTTDSKWDNPGNAPGASTSTYWQDATPGANQWWPMQIRAGGIQPGSLVASNVIANGTVSAGLLQALIVLTTTVIAGTYPNGDYAAMSPTGFRVYSAGDEVVRMGTDTNDYFAVINSIGNLVASIDDTGRGSLANLSVTGDPIFQGVSLNTRLQGYVGASPGRFSGFPPAQAVGSYGPIINRVGIAEVNGFLTAGRDYQIGWIATGMCDVDDSVETRVYLQYQGPTSSGSNTANPPNVSTSTEVDHWLHTFHAATRWETVTAAGRFSCTTTGRHRFLLASERGALGRTGNTTAAIYWRPEHRVSLLITDIGPTSVQTGQFTQASGAFSGGSAPSPPPTPTQQFYTEINRTSQFTYQGGGTQRGDTTDVVQGWDPSGTNGDGYGFFGFNNIPSITGTVDRVDVWMYFYHWYYNSGGTAIINMLKAGTATNAGQFNALKTQTDLMSSGWPKPGGMWVTLPSGWWPSFANAAGANKTIGMSLGPSGGSNELYYGRATDCSLRIWYTQ
jgi:hypothetical protein